jgi:hypothetical protein
MIISRVRSDASSPVNVGSKLTSGDKTRTVSVSGTAGDLSKASRSIFILFAVAAILFLPVAGAMADLTVTVRENADGSTTFNLSGTSSLNNRGILWTPAITNYSVNLPPVANPGLFYPLPAGLSLVGNGGEIYPIDYLISPDSFWFLSSSSTVQTELSTISGSGSVRIADFPFFVLTPGTFLVEAAPLPPESGPDTPAESVRGETGFYPYNTIYTVLPFERNPSVAGRPPGVLNSRSGKAASGLIRITNSGNTPLENLSLSEDSRDFKLGKPLRTTLAPGDSTSCKVTFSSRKSSAGTKVWITAFTPTRTYRMPDVERSSEDGLAGMIEPPIPSSLVLPGEPVGTSLTVIGQNAAEVRAPRNPVRFLQSRSNRR